MSNSPRDRNKWKRTSGTITIVVDRRPLNRRESKRDFKKLSQVESWADSFLRAVLCTSLQLFIVADIRSQEFPLMTMETVTGSRDFKSRLHLTLLISNRIFISEQYANCLSALNTQHAAAFLSYPAWYTIHHKVLVTVWQRIPLSYCPSLSSSSLWYLERAHSFSSKHGPYARAFRSHHLWVIRECIAVFYVLDVI
jgi:hypothetical protein